MSIEKRETHFLTVLLRILTLSASSVNRDFDNPVVTSLWMVSEMLFKGIAIAISLGGVLAVFLVDWSPSPRNPEAQFETSSVETAPAGWPAMFGPRGDSHSSVTGLLHEWDADGPPLLWEHPLGEGYSVPVVSDGKLIVFYRTGDAEIIQCLDSKTGMPLWDHRYPTQYECEYEYSNGPYSTPIIQQDCVFAVGAEGRMSCLRLLDGSVVWERQLKEEFPIPDALFGYGPGLAIDGDRVILNLGAAASASEEADAGIAALSTATGKTIWTATSHRMSYATPVSTTIHGRRMIFVFTYEGLVAVGPKSGDVFWQVPFKSDVYLSVNSCSPVVWKDLVVVTVGPGPGSLCLRVKKDGSFEELWRNERSLDST